VQVLRHEAWRKGVAGVASERVALIWCALCSLRVVVRGERAAPPPIAMADRLSVHPTVS
jgi:hypothetical protein